MNAFVLKNKIMKKYNILSLVIIIKILTYNS